VTALQGANGGASPPPLERWTLFRISLGELGASSWERINWKNDAVSPSAEFFVDEVRLVRFAPGAPPEAPAAPPLASPPPPAVASPPPPALQPPPVVLPAQSPPREVRTARAQRCCCCAVTLTASAKPHRISLCAGGAHCAAAAVRAAAAAIAARGGGRRARAAGGCSTAGEHFDGQPARHLRRYE
jgi:hypothetical protein